MTYTEEQVRQMVRNRGEQKAFAAMADVSPPMVHQFLIGKRRPGPKILAALGLEKSPCVYRRIGA